MKRRSIISVVTASVCICLMTSCIGQFAMFNNLKRWNDTVGDKWANELVFVAFWILPVYEVAGLADLLVLNSIEFWHGKNPVSYSSHTVEADDGTVYQITSDNTGYSIKSDKGDDEIRLSYNSDAESWSIIGSDGREHVFMTFVDDAHVNMLMPDGTYNMYELSSQGIMAYSNEIGDQFALANK